MVFYDWSLIFNCINMKNLGLENQNKSAHIKFDETKVNSSFEGQKYCVSFVLFWVIVS